MCSAAVKLAPDLQAAFDSFPDSIRDDLLRVRALILAVATETPAIGRVEETLKWGQPSYLTPETKSGSTIRLGVPKAGGYAIYTHCQTSLIADFQSLFPDDFTYEGNRAVVFADGEKPDEDKLRLLIKSALTYHLKSKA